jgi:serine protease
VVSAVVLAAAPVSPAVAAPGSGTGNPYAPSYQHPYRHGAVPTMTQLAQMRAYSAATPDRPRRPTPVIP